MTTNGKTKAPATILDQIQATVAEKKRWESGESVILHQSKNFRVSITEGGRDGGGILFLIGIVGEWPKHRQVTARCGMRGLGTWFSVISDTNYETWVRQCKRALGLPLDQGGSNGA